VTDIPVIFSAPMVQALLAGRKTMTRRLAWGKYKEFPEIGQRLRKPSPWTKVSPGDRLWVRETVACGACALGPPSHWSPGFWRREQGTPANPNGIWYAADGLAPADPMTERGRWVPSIHMPRWCSRLTLIVSAVKVERLQSISPQDAWDEGVDRKSRKVRQMWLFGADAEEREAIYKRACVWEFEDLWKQLHGDESWDENPEVVAVSFEVVKTNIDRSNPVGAAA